MKIINIVTQEEAAGAQNVAYQLSRQLIARGHSSLLLFLYTKRKVPDFGRESISLMPHVYKGPGDILRIAVRLYRYLRRERPDIVICHTHYANMLAVPIAWLAGVPIRVAVHHNPVDTYPSAVQKTDRTLGSTKLCSAHIAVSNVVRDSCESYPAGFRRKMSVVLNGVESPPGDIKPKSFPFPSEMPVLIHVGRLSRQKNQLTLLKVLRHLSGIAVVFVGEGELRHDLREEAIRLGLGNRVHFAGELDRQNVWACLKAADLFVFPSLFESMGLALVEAMAAGLPVIAGNLPATREVLTMPDGNLAGVLVDSRDAQAIAVAVRELLDKPERMAQFAEMGQVRSRDYDIARMADGYEKILNQLMSSEGTE